MTQDKIIRVSVIIPTYNSESTIRRCLDSCINQNFEEFDIIVIDNASSDSTLSIVEEYINLDKYVISEKDSGIYEAFNKGIDAAKSEWLLFLGSDDYFSQQDALGKLIQASIIVEGCNLVTSQIDVISSEGVVIQSSIGLPFSSQMILRHMIIANPSALYRKSLFKHHGYYDESFKIAGDYDFLLRTRNSIVSTHINESLVIFGSNGVSRKNVHKTALEGFRALMNNCSFGWVYGVLFYSRTLLAASRNRFFR